MMRYVWIVAVLITLAGCGAKSVDNSAREELLDRHQKASERLDRHTGQ